MPLVAAQVVSLPQSRTELAFPSTDRITTSRRELASGPLAFGEL